MSTAITRRGRSAASALCLLPGLLLGPLLGCTTATRIEYQHEPTQSVRSDHNLNRAELRPFMIDGVVAAPLIRPLSELDTQVWLTLWSTSEKVVTVRAVQFVGTGAHSAMRQQFPAEMTGTTDKNDIKGVQRGSILFGLLKSDAAAAMVAEGSARLELELRVGPAADFHHLAFDITRHTTKEWVTH